MLTALSQLFSAQNYIPHGVCLLWQPGLLWLDVLSDAVIAAAYYSIPVALIYFVSRRHDLAFRGIFVLTGLFILACGTTHVMGVVTLWYPAYWTDGLIRFYTALVSIGTAFAMWQVVPMALALPSTTQLERANSLLEHEIGERQRTSTALRDANARLERRVTERTAELETEIEQRRRTEETLRASEARWRSMFDSSAVGIALVDETGHYGAVNGAFQKMLGYTAGELCSLGPVDITHEDDRQATQDMINDMLANRRTAYDVEKRYRRKDGTFVRVRVSTARPPDPSSNMRGIPMIIEDITERRRAEDAMHEARDELLRVSRLSTMGELSASIAHEVNQPLGAIVSNGQACLRLLAVPKPDIQDLREAVEEMISDGKRASEVLRRIRALVRNISPERKPLDVNEVVDEVLALTRQELRTYGVSAQTELNRDLPLVHADRVQLQQVVLNLVMNAIEAMRETSDRPRTLSLRSEPGQLRDVVVSVADNGAGLATGAVAHVFDAFFTTKAEGMGMGLSICNSIVRAHGGRLSAAPGVPHGAVFSFSLPAIEGNRLASAERSVVMIVDDDASIRKAARRLIKSCGLAVETFASADDFLASGRIEVTACLVLDMHMPGLSGLELQQHLCTRGYSVPIIFITAFADEAARAQALAAGACRYLVKPFEEDDLLDGVREALQWQDPTGRSQPLS
jgi:PAS domain S-box-containing protein